MALKIVYVEISKTSIREIVVNSQADADRDGVYGALLLEGGAPTRTTDPVLPDADLTRALRIEKQQFQNAVTAKLTNLYYFKSANTLYINRAHALKARDTNLRSSYLRHPECLFLVPLSFIKNTGNGFVEFTDIDGDKINLSYTYPNFGLAYGSLAYQDNATGFDENNTSDIFSIRENPLNSVSTSSYMISQVTKSTDFSSTGRFFTGRPITAYDGDDRYYNTFSEIFSDKRGSPLIAYDRSLRRNVPVFFITNFPKGLNKSIIAKYNSGGGFGYCEGRFFQALPTSNLENNYSSVNYSNDVEFVTFDPNNKDLFNLNSISPNNAVMPFVYIDHKGQKIDAGNGSSFRIFDDNYAGADSYYRLMISKKTGDFIGMSQNSNNIIWDSAERPLENSTFNLPAGTELIVGVSGEKIDGSFFAKYTKIDGSKYNLLYSQSNILINYISYYVSNIPNRSPIASSFDALYSKDIVAGNQNFSIIIPKLTVLNDVNLNSALFSKSPKGTLNYFVPNSSLNTLTNISRTDINSVNVIEGKVGLIDNYINGLLNSSGNPVSVNFSNLISNGTVSTPQDIDENSYTAYRNNLGAFVYNYMTIAYARNTLNTNNNQTS